MWLFKNQLEQLVKDLTVLQVGEYFLLNMSCIYDNENIQADQASLISLLFFIG